MKVTPIPLPSLYFVYSSILGLVNMDEPEHGM